MNIELYGGDQGGDKVREALEKIRGNQSQVALINELKEGVTYDHIKLKKILSIFNNHPPFKKLIDKNKFDMFLSGFRKIEDQIDDDISKDYQDMLTFLQDLNLDKFTQSAQKAEDPPRHQRNQKKKKLRRN